MKIHYDPEADVLCLRLSDAPIDEGDEVKPGVIVSYDAGGNVVSVEILGASRHIPDLGTIQFTVFGPLTTIPTPTFFSSGSVATESEPQRLSPRHP
jgi:uncharacterized protein YuzE